MKIYNIYSSSLKKGPKPDEVPQKSPMISPMHFYRIMKQKLKVRINEPVKDRCTICADILAQRSREKNPTKKAFYDETLAWHLKQKRSQKSLLRSIESLVKPYD